MFFCPSPLTCLDMIKEFIVISVPGAATSFFFTGLALKIARRLKLFDAPSRRKIHKKGVPRVGGIALVVSFFACLSLSCFFAGFSPGVKFLLPLVIPALIIVLLGVYDDIKGANAAQKFSFQIICAVLVYCFSVRIDFISIPFAGTIRLGNLSLPLTVLWIVLTINAFNLIDGLDGLLCRIALYAAGSLVVVFFIANDPGSVLVFLLLAGTLIGFLPWNLYPARIFMGDTGSMFIGFIFAVFSMVHYQKGSLAVSLTIPMIILFVPLFDTGWAFVRRVGAGKSPFKSDKRHIHHRIFLKYGDHKKASFVLSTLSGFFSALGVVAVILNPAYRTIFVLFAFVAGLGLILLTRGKQGDVGA